MNRILVVLGLLLALLGGAGCGLIDTRPKSTYAEFVQAASALAGVDSVIATGSSEFQLTLDTGAQEAELADTSQALFDLVNGHRYPDGAPTLSVESGVFTGEIGPGRWGAVGAAEALLRPGLQPGSVPRHPRGHGRGRHGIALRGAAASLRGRRHAVASIP